MKVLLLGGTGAMGVPLIDFLARDGQDVVVTSRTGRKDDRDNVRYIMGNARDDAFLNEVLSEKYDAVVDFMHYHAGEFKKRLELLLNSTDHYFFLSSSRVYAPSEKPLTEDSPRLLDVVSDEKYLATEEYALEKARCENLLFQNHSKNWTIIRPYITYNTERLQLSIFEKEGWLYRALQGKSIVFSKDLASKKTSLTHGKDVAKVMADLIEKKAGMGEAIHIVGRDSMTWNEILEIYLDVIEEVMHFRPNVVMLENGTELGRVVGNSYKFRYDRMVDKCFDSSKADRLCQKEIQYIGMNEGLSQALKDLLQSGKKINRPGIMLEAYLDKCAGENEKMGNYSLMKRVKYLAYRYTPYLGRKIKARGDIWW